MAGQGSVFFFFPAGERGTGKGEDEEPRLGAGNRAHGRGGMQSIVYSAIHPSGLLDGLFFVTSVWNRTVTGCVADGRPCVLHSWHSWSACDVMVADGDGGLNGERLSRCSTLEAGMDRRRAGRRAEERAA